jgi:hypothetical protein
MPDGRLVNGQELQNDTPANLAFDVPHLISYIVFDGLGTLRNAVRQEMRRCAA